MKSKENKSFSQLLREIESDVSALRDYPDDFVHGVTDKIQSNVVEAKQTIRGLRILSFISAVMFIVSIIVIILTITYYSKADKIINEQPTRFDSVANKILGINERDSIQTFDYIVDKNDKLISYQDLVKESKTFHKTRDSLGTYKDFETIIEKKYGVKMKLIPTKDKNAVIVSLEQTRKANLVDGEKEADKGKPTVKKTVKDTVSIK